MSETSKPHNVRLWDWLAHHIPSGAYWLNYGRWSWQRRIASWWLPWWGWAFMYTDPWRPGRKPRDW